MRLLLLAGTAEAREVAEELSGTPGLIAVASLAGGTRNPLQLKLPSRMGGFGGAEAFRLYLARHDIDAVLDATHPFAAAMSHRTARICAETDLPYAQLLRPEWTPGLGDAWHMIDRPEAAAEHIPEGAAIFLATGHGQLSKFANLSGRRVFCRRIDATDAPFPFPGGEFVFGRPPFGLQDEKETFARLGIDWLVVKNSGGASGRAKLDAAREMGIGVVMIERPPQPEARRFGTARAAVDWVRSLQ